MGGIFLGWLLGSKWKWSIILLLAPVYWATVIYGSASDAKGSCPDWGFCLDFTKSDAIILFPLALIFSAAGTGVAYLLSRKRARQQSSIDATLNEKPDASDYLASKAAAESEESRKQATGYGKAVIDKESNDE